MISDFLESWPLFGDTYLAAWLAAAILGLTGIVTVARDQIFVGAAITQASLLGMGLALWAALQPWALNAAWLQSPHLATGLTIGFGILTTVVALPRRHGRQTAEGLTGWIFLAATAATIVLLAHSPVGQREIDQRLASSIIGATRGDVWVLAASALLCLLAVLRWHAPLRLLLTDPPMARAVGLPTGRWELVLAVLLGAIIGFCLRTTGMLYTFGCLVLPGLAAKSCCRTLRGMLVLAPLLALAAALIGFVIAYQIDVPPAPMAVLLLALLLPLARGIGWLRSRH